MRYLISLSVLWGDNEFPLPLVNDHWMESPNTMGLSLYFERHWWSEVMNGYLWNPWVHHVVTLVHISAGLFWLGWMVFMFGMLLPVLRRRVPDRVQVILPSLKQRVRRVVLGLIVVIVLTGLYNVYYNGLHRLDVLLETSYGHRFLIKLSAALVLFTVYGAAPYLAGEAGTESCGGGCSKQGANTGWMGAALHGLAFLSGLIAALFGLSLGG